MLPARMLKFASTYILHLIAILLVDISSADSHERSCWRPERAVSDGVLPFIREGN